MRWWVVLKLTRKTFYYLLYKKLKSLRAAAVISNLNRLKISESRIKWWELSDSRLPEKLRKSKINSISIRKVTLTLSRIATMTTTTYNNTRTLMQLDCKRISKLSYKNRENLASPYSARALQSLEDYRIPKTSTSLIIFKSYTGRE